MIKTRFTIQVEIDGKIFTVTVKELNPTEKKKLEIISKENDSMIEEESEKGKKREELSISIDEIQSIIDTNKELLKEVGIVDKLSLLLENKRLSTDLARLKKEKMNVDIPNFTKVNEVLEKIYKEKFNLAVEGEEKESLKCTAEENNVSYSSIWEEIDNEIKEQTKKKSNASEDGQSK